MSTIVPAGTNTIVVPHVVLKYLLAIVYICILSTRGTSGTRYLILVCTCCWYDIIDIPAGMHMGGRTSRSRVYN